MLILPSNLMKRWFPRYRALQPLCICSVSAQDNTFKWLLGPKSVTWDNCRAESENLQISLFWTYQKCWKSSHLNNNAKKWTSIYIWVLKTPIQEHTFGYCSINHLDKFLTNIKSWGDSFRFFCKQSQDFPMSWHQKHVDMHGFWST